MNEINVTLVGNPNVGKSSIFNYLTKSYQHTGNWTGKTVSVATANIEYKNKIYKFHDLPGTYTLMATSKEEEITRDYLYNNKDDITIIVVDSTLLEKGLNLTLQTIKICTKPILCLNLIDIAKKKKIEIDIKRLQNILKIPIVCTSARNKLGFDKLLEEIYKLKAPNNNRFKVTFNKEIENQIDTKDVIGTLKKISENKDNQLSIASTYINISQNIAKATIKNNKKDRVSLVDKILTNKITSILFMLTLLLLIFWLTIIGSNYPSTLLSNLFSNLEQPLYNILEILPDPIQNTIVFGIYKVLSWVVAVMLPPMAIFFPLFALLEEIGLLPRIAFNLDGIFNKCNTCGKQALTMCMGFGCNAVGVTGTRIIDNKKERIIAMITNVFVPCNGRFPMIIAILSMFFIDSNSTILNTFIIAIYLTLIILFSFLITFIISLILSKIIMKKENSLFILELPEYRKPKILKVIIDTFINKTLKILYRAIKVATIAGLIIYILASTNILTKIALILNPFATLIGMDGTILLSFILGFPANEIVVPLILMIYENKEVISDYESLSNLKSILINNGWNTLTALSTILFSLFHFPCGTTLLTIKHETGSNKSMFLSFIIPLITGLIICFLLTFVFRLPQLIK